MLTSRVLPVDFPPFAVFLPLPADFPVPPDFPAAELLPVCGGLFTVLFFFVAALRLLREREREFSEFVTPHLVIVEHVPAGAGRRQQDRISGEGITGCGLNRMLETVCPDYIIKTASAAGFFDIISRNSE